ncbi:MAG: DNA polymerase III subunit gamma/tau [Erythrobacter sp.]
MSDSEPQSPGEPDTDAPSAAELEAAGQDTMFGDTPPATAPVRTAETAAPAQAAPDPAQPYRVLARKYRPQTFSELIGQEPMVQTLGNAIERERLAHAFLMTGVRGVGKTSTARLIAKALNCIGPDGEGGPTIDPCGVCEPCRAIAEGRHIDVIEMDAASHTGVDDVRDIIEQVRYAAVSARYKIYIIDEVHMLSRNAFNALLKTLEEPPAHVKFLFATTEVEKLPVTVLSRTQRFDLRRIPADLLTTHFAKICASEGIEAEDEALRIIAGAAEGSVRDGLSILDQAIAHADLEAGGLVTAERVRDMLGLADKSAQRRLLAMVLEGNAAALLKSVAEQYALGVEPLALMRALMDLVHRVSVANMTGGEPDAPGEEERAALRGLADKLSAGQLHRLWQLLLKGHDEVKGAPDPLVALEMALLRVLYASQTPDPGALARRVEELAKGNVALAPQSSDSQGPPITASAPSTESWAALVERVDAMGQLRAAQIMRDRIRVIALAPERVVYAPADDFADDPAPDIREALFKLTGKHWQVERGEGNANPSLREAKAAAAKADQVRILAHPLVAKTFEAFPDAELLDTGEPLAHGAKPGSA